MAEPESHQVICTPPYSGRNGRIDFWKFVFTLFVMLFHGANAGPLFQDAPLFPNGYIGVEFFFLVSGFLMARSMEHPPAAEMPLGKETFRFVFHKATRLFPYYIFAWFLSFTMTQIIDHASLGRILHTLLLSIPQLFFFDMAGAFNLGFYLSASWYLSVMLIAMLILYPLRRKLRSIFDWVLAPLMGLFLLSYAFQTCGNLCLVVSYVPNLYMYDGMIRAIAEIALGCTCFAICKQLSALHLRRFVRVALTFIELGGYLSIIWVSHYFGFTALDFSFLFVFAVCIIISFSGQSCLQSFFNNRFFHFLGDFSLPVYLVHMIVLEKLLPLYESVCTFSPVAFYVVASLGLAALCYFVGGQLKKLPLRRLLCR